MQLLNTKQIRGGTSGRWLYDDGTKALWAVPGGDLAGSAPNPSVVKIQGVSVDSTTPTDGQYLKYSSSAGKWVPATPGFGTGSVTSVGLSLPAMFSVSGSPVTTSGTITATLASQSANSVFAGPSSGSAAAPTFRALVAADMPSAGVHSGDATGTFPTVTLAASGVSAATYGDSTHVAQVAVDAKGRITSASNVGISGLGTFPPTWSSSVTYAAGDVVRGSDGNWYRATAGSNTNHNPTTSNQTWWELNFCTSNLTLTIDNSRFNGLSTAAINYTLADLTFFNSTPSGSPVWPFIQNARIAGAATLTIQFDYTDFAGWGFGAVQALAHPFGSQIRVQGDITGVSKPTLTLSGFSGFSVGASRLAFVDGFILDGVSKTSGTIGVLCSGVSFVNLGSHNTIKNFDIGMLAGNGSYIGCTGGTVTACNIGLQALSIGNINCTSPLTVSSCTTGVYATNGAKILAPNFTMTSNTTHFDADHDSYIYAGTPSFTGGTTQYTPTVNTVGNQNSYISNV
jgi:hypothetical protein